jgi:hypothetical protein
LKQETEYHRGISIHRIPVEGAVGLLFAFATVFIFAVGIPAVRGLLLITGTFGILGSGILHFWHANHHKKIDALHLDATAESTRQRQPSTHSDKP